MTTKPESDRPDDYLSRLAASDLGRAYKALVLEQLAVEQGAFVVDLGCGPGADLAAFADKVGPGGRVLGIDVDTSALDQAGRVAARYAAVSVEQGDAHRLRLEDRCVDRLHTDRVLQHVADPSAAVAEIARVLRPSGVVALAEPDWDTLVIDCPDPAIPLAYRSFVTDRVVRNSRIGRALPGLCETHGLTVARVLPVTAVFRDVAEADRLFGFARVSRRAVEAGYLSADQAQAWLAHLSSERLFASVTLFVTIAEAS